jgi:zinc protease
LSAILGGWKGLIGYSRDRFVPRSNRLYKSLVEKKIASDVNISLPIGFDPSLLYFQITIMPNSTIDIAKDALFDQLAKAAESAPSEEEMKIVSNQIRSWHAYENDGTASQALTLGTMELIQDKSFADILVERSLTITPEQVLAVARKYLGERNRTVCTYRIEGHDLKDGIQEG